MEVRMLRIGRLSRLSFWLPFVIGTVVIVGWLVFAQQARVVNSNSPELLVNPPRPQAAEQNTTPPGIPSSFYGSVMLNGKDAPTTANVSAWIGDRQVAQQPIKLDHGRAYYAVNVPADNPATPVVEGGKPGDTIAFRVDHAKATQQGTWQSGSNVQLDLSAAAP
jgi:hypothetical protein